MISDAVAITLIVSILLVVLTMLTRPRQKELSELREILLEVIGLTPAAKALNGMPSSSEILTELRRLKETQ